MSPTVKITIGGERPTTVEVEVNSIITLQEAATAIDQHAMDIKRHDWSGVSTSTADRLAIEIKDLRNLADALRGKPSNP